MEEVLEEQASDEEEEAWEGLDACVGRQATSYLQHIFGLNAGQTALFTTSPRLCIYTKIYVSLSVRVGSML